MQYSRFLVQSLHKKVDENNWMKDIKIHSSRVFLLFCVMLASVQYWAVAEVRVNATTDCKVVVEVNDPNANIFIDGKNIGHSPVQIKCKQKNQKIQIIASDGQTFTRLLPNQDSMSEIDQSMHVVFQSMGSQRVNLDSNNNQNALVLRELARIRLLLEELTNKKQAPKNAVLSQAPENAVLSQAPINSVIAREPTALQAGFSPGFYVQLYTLSKKIYDTQRVLSDFKEGVSAAKGSMMKFCKWQNSNGEYMQVVVGPFINWSIASEVKTFIKRDSFVLKKVQCVPMMNDISIE